MLLLHTDLQLRGAQQEAAKGRRQTETQTIVILFIVIVFPTCSGHHKGFQAVQMASGSNFQEIGTNSLMLL